MNTGRKNEKKTLFKKKRLFTTYTHKPTMYIIYALYVYVYITYMYMLHNIDIENITLK